MALPNVGGGEQIGDGNLNELKLGYMATPPTATATATLTAAQITGSILVANPSTSAAAYTLPLATDLDALLVNAKIGSTFNLIVVNLGTSSGVITMTTNTGWTLSGLATIAITTSAQFVARKTAAGAWTLYTTG